MVYYEGMTEETKKLAEGYDKACEAMADKVGLAAFQSLGLELNTLNLIVAHTRNIIEAVERENPYRPEP